MATNLGYIDRLGATEMTLKEKCAYWAGFYQPIQQKAFAATKYGNPDDIKNVLAEIKPLYVQLDKKFLEEDPAIYNSTIGRSLRDNVEIQVSRAGGRMITLYNERLKNLDPEGNPLPDAGDEFGDDEGFKIPWLPIGLAAGAIGLVFALKG